MSGVNDITRARKYSYILGFIKSAVDILFGTEIENLECLFWAVLVPCGSTFADDGVDAVQFNIRFKSRFW